MSLNFWWKLTPNSRRCAWTQLTLFLHFLTVLLQQDLLLGPKNSRQKELQEAGCEAVMTCRFHSRTGYQRLYCSFLAALWILQFPAALEHVGR